MANVKTTMGIYTGAKASEADNNLVRMEDFLDRRLAYAGGNQDQRIEGAASSIRGQFVNPDSIRKFASRTAPTLTPITAIQLAFTNPVGTTPDGQGKEKRAVKRALLTKTVSGQNDDLYKRCFDNMASAGFDRYFIRFGSEGDIAWPPHSFMPMDDHPRGNDDLYRDAFAHVVTLAREVFEDKLTSIYTTTAFAGQLKMVCADGRVRSKLEAGYPGGQYVDVVGCDLYLAKDVIRKLDERAKITQGFAFNRGKQFAFDEWGITPDGRKTTSGNQIAFIRWMHQFLDGLPTKGAGSLSHHSLFAEWAQSDFFDDYLASVKWEVKKLFGG